MWTHFKYDEIAGQFDLFSLDSCDRCQEDIQAANSVGKSTSIPSPPKGD